MTNFLMKTSIELMAEFISPFEDNLFVFFIGDNFDTDTTSLFTKAINRSRKSLPGFLDKVKFNSITTSQLYHSQNSDILKEKACIQILDAQLSLNLISYLTNELDDELEAMLIDRHILQVQQEKYIFDITNVSDDTLATLCQNMDKKEGSYNYLISENYLGIWILYKDEFSFIQDLA